jgi:hypothetical protein
LTWKKNPDGANDLKHAKQYSERNERKNSGIGRKLGANVYSRVARFFLVQNTKKGKNIPNYHELYKISIKYSKRP